jgi:hypothetical protein
MKTHLFRENRKAEMIVAKEFHVKIHSSASQTRLKGKGNRIFRQTKEKAPERDKKQERAIGGWVGVVNWRPEEPTNILLELQTAIKVQAGGQIRGGSHGSPQGGSPVDHCDDISLLSS